MSSQPTRPRRGSVSANGQIDLEWLHEADGRLILCWREMGGPAVQMPTHRGFGTRVIESAMAN